MYTECPRCHTVFRLSAAALQQASGQVRCGNCKVAFNALASLSEDPPPNDPASKPAKAPTDVVVTQEDQDALLRSLESFGAPDVELEDTGIEWRVLNLEHDPRDDDDENIVDSHDYLVEENVSPAADDGNNESDEIVVKYDDGTVAKDDTNGATDSEEIILQSDDEDEEGPGQEGLGADSLETSLEAADTDAEDNADIVGDEDYLVEDDDSPAADDDSDEPSEIVMKYDDGTIAEDESNESDAGDHEIILESGDEDEDDEDEDLDADESDDTNDLEEDEDEDDSDEGLDEDYERLDLDNSDTPDEEHADADNDDLSDEVEDTDDQEIILESGHEDSQSDDHADGDLDEDEEDLGAAESDDTDGSEDEGKDDDPDSDSDSDSDSGEDLYEDYEKLDFNNSDTPDEEDRNSDVSGSNADSAEQPYSLTELRFDDDTPLPDDYLALDVDFKLQPEQPPSSPSLDTDSHPQEELALDDADDWAELLDEVDDLISVEESNGESPESIKAGDIEVEDNAADHDATPSAVEESNRESRQPDEPGDIEVEDDLAGADATPLADDEPVEQQDDDSASKASPVWDIKDMHAVEAIVMEGDDAYDSMNELTDYDIGDFDKTGPSSIEPGSSTPDGKKKTSPWIVLAAVLLIIVLLVQVGHAWREQLATLPYFNQTIGQLYRLFDKPVTANWDVTGWQFDTTTGNTNDSNTVLTIESKLSNRGKVNLPYPVIHVALTDRWEQVIGSRVIEPREYLGKDADLRDGVAPNASFNAVINVEDPGADADGFKLNVCYRADGDQLRCATGDFLR